MTGRKRDKVLLWNILAALVFLLLTAYIVGRYANMHAPMAYIYPVSAAMPCSGGPAPVHAPRDTRTLQRRGVSVRTGQRRRTVLESTLASEVR